MGGPHNGHLKLSRIFCLWIVKGFSVKIPTTFLAWHYMGGGRGVSTTLVTRATYVKYNTFFETTPSLARASTLLRMT